MDYRQLKDRNAIGPGAVVIGIGAVLAGLHLWHGSRELGENLAAAIFGVAVPLVVSAVVIGGSYWITTRDWADASPWRAVGWCGAGMVMAALLAVLLVRYQTAHGVALYDPFFAFAIHATYGAAIGLGFAYYDLRTRETTARLRRESQRLDEFASIVSHDLRNPLNVAHGYVELTRETGDLSHLDTVADAHDRMEAIIRDTLTLARQGEEAVTLESVQLAEVATGSWEMVESSEAELRVEADRQVRADRDRLAALFENLFRNAVEHNDAPVTVTVATLASGDGFAVEDDGEGIPPAHRERVFYGGYSTDDEGTGLGLAIVRAAADAHGWEIALTDGPDGGARFEITGVEFVA